MGAVPCAQRQCLAHRARLPGSGRDPRHEDQRLRRHQRRWPAPTRSRSTSGPHRSAATRSSKAQPASPPTSTPWSRRSRILGRDDLQHILTPIIDQQLPGIVAKQAPAAFKGDWDASLDFDPFQKADANLKSISFFGGVDSMDLVPIDDAHTESKLVARLSGKASMSLSVDPVAVGIVSILSGTCSLDANLDLTAAVSARLGLEAENDRPKLVVHVDDVGANLTSLHSSGTVLALLGIVPTDKSCSELQDSFSNGIKQKLKDGIADALKDGSLDPKVAANLDPHLLESADLLTGPFAGIRTMQDGGFAVRGWSYQPTANDNVLGDHLLLWDGGLDVAANGAIADLGGDRFPYSARPSTTESVAGVAHERRRPDGSFFDLGAIISGASVNQLARAASAGSGDGTGLLDVTPRPCDPPKPDDPTPPPPCDPPVTVRPSAALQYVPSVPADWPTTGAAQAFIPSLRLQTPVAEASTMAADVYIGVSSHIDTTTNQVAFDRNVVVRPRFLRLAPGTEIAIEHDPTHVGPTNIEVIGNLIKDGVGQRVQDLFQAIQVPDLSKFLVTHDLPPMTPSHLSLGTVGGGNLGVYADVDPAPTQVSVSGGFDSPDGEQPEPRDAPRPHHGLPPVRRPEGRVAGGRRAPRAAVLYQSPAGGESTTSLTIPRSSLHEFLYEPCTGGRRLRATASRQGRPEPVSPTRGPVTRCSTSKERHSGPRPGAASPAIRAGAAVGPAAAAIAALPPRSRDLSRPGPGRTLTGIRGGAHPLARQSRSSTRARGCRASTRSISACPRQGHLGGIGTPPDEQIDVELPGEPGPPERVRQVVLEVFGRQGAPQRRGPHHRAGRASARPGWTPRRPPGRRRRRPGPAGP